MKVRKQEQEEARTEVTEVFPNVLRMELPISMPGLGHVNCYALLDDEGAAVVDPGLPGPDTQKALRHRLAQAGLRETDVHTVVITHSHPDHFGCARWLAKAGGARIIAYQSFGWGIGAAPTPNHEHEHGHEVSVDDLQAHRDALDAETKTKTEAERIDAGSDRPGKSMKERWQRYKGRPSPWGGSPLGPPKVDGKESEIAKLMMSGDIFPNITHPVGDGDVVRLGGREWFIRHTPGHTADHICLHSPELELYLAGDHVLPTITPHIAGTGPSDNPLEVFMNSLDKAAATESVDRVLPAHGNPFGDLAKRTDDIKRHHFERLERVKEIGKELGPASVVDFSKKLFKERSWGMMAESETYAHLEYLRHSRDAEKYSENGQLIYVIR
jgi:glyoxylase-like metal-dependent hydrolase (beta-lactamase superfamily II)